MTDSDKIRLRLRNQRLAGIPLSSPAEVARHFGAVQAQDYTGALWAIGLRLQHGKTGESPKAVQIEQAIADRTIIRTWPMRGTLHFIAAEDARWMIRLLTPRVLMTTAAYRRRLELDAGILSRARKVIVKALEGGRLLTRPALYRLLESTGIATGNGRGSHIFFLLAQDCLICFGPREGKQPTIALFDEWVPVGVSRNLTREEAFTVLAGRYFGAHGPAAEKDFSWWSGLNLSEAREAISLARSMLVSGDFNGSRLWWMEPEGIGLYQEPARVKAHLLSNYDEYIVAYSDRSGILGKLPGDALDKRGNILFMNTILLDGRVAGTFTRVQRHNTVEVHPHLFEAFRGKKRDAVEQAIKNYCVFFDRMKPGEETTS